MPRNLTLLRAPTIIASLLVLPLVALELVNRRSAGESFPFPLFAILWVLPFIFILTLSSLVRAPRSVSVILLARIGVLVLVAVVWIFAVVDQLPCFLGVPNCD
jgi:hypothetical protein